MSDSVEKLIKKWAETDASERANFQPFCDDLCDLLDLQRPEGQKPDESEPANDNRTAEGSRPYLSTQDFEQELLTRRLALNAERAAEAAKGHIRWLRPEYQNPEGTQESTTEQTELETKPLPTPHSRLSTAAKQPWPETVAEQVAAVRNVIQQISWTSEQDIKLLAQHFKGVRALKVQAIADALITLGQAA